MIYAAYLFMADLKTGISCVCVRVCVRIGMVWRKFTTRPFFPLIQYGSWLRYDQIRHLYFQEHGLIV